MNRMRRGCEDAGVTPIRAARLIAAAAILAGGLLGCGGSDPGRRGADQLKAAATAPPLHGAVPVGARATRPSFRLVDTSGAPYDFFHRTSGHVTFLYFGYTHCPDECPTSMADVAAALRRTDPAVAE